MSKIGEKIIVISEGTTVSMEKDQVVIRGPLGEIRLSVPESLLVEIKGDKVEIKRNDEEKKTKSVHGTINRLISNAIEGVKNGFSKTLEVVGTGYRAEMEGDNLSLWVGYSHPVKFVPPQGIKIEVQENKVKVFGFDKQQVGLIAEKIKQIRKPDAYKGKGIRFLGEKLKLKPGKAAAKAGAPGAK